MCSHSFQISVRVDERAQVTLKIESVSSKKQGLCEVNSQQVNLRRKCRRLQGRLCKISAWHLGLDQVSSPSTQAAGRFPTVGFILAVVIYTHITPWSIETYILNFKLHIQLTHKQGACTITHQNILAYFSCIQNLINTMIFKTGQ